MGNTFNLMHLYNLNCTLKRNKYVSYVTLNQFLQTNSLAAYVSASSQIALFDKYLTVVELNSPSPGHWSMLFWSSFQLVDIFYFPEAISTY